MSKIAKSFDANAGESDEQTQHVSEKWFAWFAELSEKGHLKDLNRGPLQGTGNASKGKVIKGKRKIITDGPCAKIMGVVAGYVIIEAQDLERAVELAKGCPILEAGGSGEVRPIQGMVK
jgi:hypothetical protein